MRELAGRTALLTGASRGIGPYIARALVAEGMNLVLAARSAAELEAVAEEVRGAGVKAVAVPTDVGDRASLEALAARAEESGGVDVLVNNAGIENISFYDKLDPDDIEHLLRVNLVGAMLLARLVLPGMLERGRGHIVNIASLAGKSGTPYDAPYAASKAGLVGFTESLRRECRERGVSASVICPGFVRDAGMYEDSRLETGVEAPRLLGTSPPQAVARAVVRAVKREVPEIIVNPGPTRVLLVLGAVSPSLADWVIERIGVSKLFRQAVEAREREAVKPGRRG
ncbi:MAG: SDR family oxidoreductase [Chloroflexi bacterium]|nr:SDR family oxidoreductase [Chloroflexota bacterium]